MNLIYNVKLLSTVEDITSDGNGSSEGSGNDIWYKYHTVPTLPPPIDEMRKYYFFKTFIQILI